MENGNKGASVDHFETFLLDSTMKNRQQDIVALHFYKKAILGRISNM